MKRIALCFRGKCLDENIHWATGAPKKTDYNKTLICIRNNLIKANPHYNFDIYLHGWISKEANPNKIDSDFNAKASKLDKQIDFSPYYERIKNYREILKSRFSHLHKKNQYSYNDINFFDYFNNIFSYAYSISNAVKLISQPENYDLIINTRYDINLTHAVELDSLSRDKIYTDNISENHGPLFYGDFIHISKPSIGIKWKNFFDCVTENIFLEHDFRTWAKNKIKNGVPGKKDHGLYSPQMIYSYFSQTHTPHRSVFPKINSTLFRY